MALTAALLTRKPHDGGPLHGGGETPGQPGSSPSTRRDDYTGLADTKPDDAYAPALMSLRRLVRGVY